MSVCVRFQLNVKTNNHKNGSVYMSTLRLIWILLTHSFTHSHAGLLSQCVRSWNYFQTHKSRNEIEKVFSIYINPFQRQYFVTNVFTCKRKYVVRGRGRERVWVKRKERGNFLPILFLSSFGLAVDMMCCLRFSFVSFFFHFIFAAAAAIIFAQGILPNKHLHSHKHAYVDSIL